MRESILSSVKVIVLVGLCPILCLYGYADDCSAPQYSCLAKLSRVSRSTKSSLLLVRRYDHIVILIRDGNAHEIKVGTDRKVTSYPQLSPDGRLLAYRVTRISSGEKLVEIHDLQESTTRDFQSADGNSLVWSSDSHRLASLGNEQISVIGMVEGAVLAKISLPVATSTSYSHPSWSRDGDTIAIERRYDNGSVNRYDVLKIEIASSTISSLFPGLHPAWSTTDDNLIAFIDQDERACNVYDTRKRLSRPLFAQHRWGGGDITSGPLWGPDGMSLAYGVESGIKGDRHTYYLYDLGSHHRKEVLSDSDFELSSWTH